MQRICAPSSPWSRTGNSRSHRSGSVIVPDDALGELHALAIGSRQVSLCAEATGELKITGADLGVGNELRRSLQLGGTLTVMFWLEPHAPTLSRLVFC